jgi:hypothetical protein
VIERGPGEIFEEGCRELPDGFMAKRVQPPLEKEGLVQVIYLLRLVSNNTGHFSRVKGLRCENWAGNR